MSAFVVCLSASCESTYCGLSLLTFELELHPGQHHSSAAKFSLNLGVGVEALNSVMCPSGSGEHHCLGAVCLLISSNHYSFSTQSKPLLLGLGDKEISLLAYVFHIVKIHMFLHLVR